MVIISTHQVRDLENLIDPVIILDEGKIIFNQFIQETNCRLNVSMSMDQPNPEVVLYMEKTFNGYLTVTENKSSEESNINLETLFSTVISIFFSCVIPIVCWITAFFSLKEMEL